MSELSYQIQIPTAQRRLLQWFVSSPAPQTTKFSILRTNWRGIFRAQHCSSPYSLIRSSRGVVTKIRQKERSAAFANWPRLTVYQVLAHPSSVDCATYSTG